MAGIQLTPIGLICRPHRPNCLDLSIVKLQRIEGNRVHFTEADMLDGTPPLDIKPSVGHFD